MNRRRSTLITGSTSGIGLAIAGELAARGMKLMLNGFGDAAEIETPRAQRLLVGFDHPQMSQNQVNLKLIPHVDGTPAIAQLVALAS